MATPIRSAIWLAIDLIAEQLALPQTSLNSDRLLIMRGLLLDVLHHEGDVEYQLDLAK